MHYGLLFAAFIALSPAIARDQMDVNRIDRTIAKEPKYQAKPQYCLVFVGAQAKTRVWLVRDGNVLYVDSNGNGDLTEPSKAVHSLPFNGQICFAYPKIEDKSDGPCHTDLRIAVSEDRWEIRVDVHGRLQQYAFTDGRADRPGDAPVVHFGGPLQFDLRSDTTLSRGGSANDLQVSICTKYPGVQPALLDHCKGVPHDVHPLAEITFPGATPDSMPITSRVRLPLRC